MALGDKRSSATATNRKVRGKARENATADSLRTVDKYFEQFAAQSQHSGNRALQYLFMPLWCFGLLGLIWMIPFPEIAFLKKHGYHIFLNWASFFIAIVIYYYLRLAPTLSYAVLFSIGVASFFIVQLEYVEADGGPAVWFVCAMLMLFSSIALWLGNRQEDRPASPGALMKQLVHSPIWLWHFAFKRFKVPY